MPTGEYTFRSEPPHTSQVVSESSVNFWTTSSRSSHAVHAYWYVGTDPPCPALALTATDCQMLTQMGRSLIPPGPLSERQPGDPGGGAGHQPHPLVVVVGRDLVQQLAVVDERDRGDSVRDPGQGAVVAAAAAAEPDAAAVDGQGRHQHQVGPGYRVHAAGRLGGLGQAARPGAQRIGALVGGPVQIGVRAQQRE